jgi:hypothetical protein
LPFDIWGTMALGSTQPLTEMSTRNLSGGKGRPARDVDYFTAICELVVMKMWEARRLTTVWAFMACYKIALPLTLHIVARSFSKLRVWLDLALFV